MNAATAEQFATVDALATVYKSSIIAVCGENEIWYATVTNPPSKQSSSAHLSVEWLKISRTTSTGAIVLKLSGEKPARITLGSVLDVVRHTLLVGNLINVDVAEQRRLQEIGNLTASIICCTLTALYR